MPNRVIQPKTSQLSGTIWKKKQNIFVNEVYPNFLLIPLPQHLIHSTKPPFEFSHFFGWMILVDKMSFPNKVGRNILAGIEGKDRALGGNWSVLILPGETQFLTQYDSFHSQVDIPPHTSECQDNLTLVFSHTHCFFFPPAIYLLYSHLIFFMKRILFECLHFMLCLSLNKW